MAELFTHPCDSKRDGQIVTAAGRHTEHQTRRARWGRPVSAAQSATVLLSVWGWHRVQPAGAVPKDPPPHEDGYGERKFWENDLYLFFAGWERFFPGSLNSCPSYISVSGGLK